MDNTEKTDPVEEIKKYQDSEFVKTCKLGIYESLYVYYKKAKNRLVGDDRVIYEDCLFNFNNEISYARAAIEQGDESAFDMAIRNLDLINASLEKLDKKDVEFSLSSEPNSIKFTNHDGKILAEIPTDKLISKEHNDSLDVLSYVLKAQEEIKPLRKPMPEDYEKTKVVDEFAEIPPKPDMVNHPPHYNVEGFEVIDIIKAFTEGLKGIVAVDDGNAIKYILRWPHKNGVEDLKKARWYIDHLIKTLEENDEQD